MSASRRALVREAPLLGTRPALTGLRAFAVVVVMLHHQGYFLSTSGTRWFARDGYVGVDIFFVLSGFLITTLLLEEHVRASGIALPAFHARRARRLLPALGALLLVWTGYSLWVQHVSAAVMGTSVALVAGYATNVYAALGSGHHLVAGFAHLWSLAVEEQFYVAWPIVLILTLRRRRPVEFAVAVGAAVLASAVDMAVTYHHAGNIAAYDRTDCRAGALLIGCLASLAWRQGWVSTAVARRLLLPCLALLILILEIAPPPPAVMFDGGFTIVEVLAAVVVVVALEPGRSARRSGRAR